jgi:hypothetical protein
MDGPVYGCIISRGEHLCSRNEQVMKWFVSRSFGVLGTPYEFCITVQDVKRVKAHLGFKVRCQDLAAIYNKQPGAKSSGDTIHNY